MREEVLEEEFGAGVSGVLRTPYPLKPVFEK